jgi:conjugative transfer region protein (TIGR03750 family)
MTSSGRLLAERLNDEPPIFRGCSSSELGLITGLAILIWLPISVLVAWVLGAATMGLGLAGIAIVVTVIVTGSVFQRIKRGRPDGYYQQKLMIALARLRLRPSPFIRQDGNWSIGRQRPV